MIVDCHTHIWDSPDQLGKAQLDLQARAHRGMEAGPNRRSIPDATIEEHQRASEPVDKSFVLGFKSRYAWLTAGVTETARSHQPTVAAQDPESRVNPGLEKIILPSGIQRPAACPDHQPSAPGTMPRKSFTRPSSLTNRRLDHGFLPAIP